MALCKDPARRFATATAMRQALAQAVASPVVVKAGRASLMPASARLVTSHRTSFVTVPEEPVPVPVSVLTGPSLSAMPSHPTADTLLLPPAYAVGSAPA
ncbi:MAG: hypothetical protein ACUVR8_00275, partial [Acidobacteriota bacterium]